MKTEISRDSFNINKRYSGVYQQQGRMLTDSDWNELVDILKERLGDALKDVVGNGSPLHRNIINNDITPPRLEWGYLYVDGIQAEARPAENATLQPVLELDKQEDFPSSPSTSGDFIIYADVWERTVTRLMDDDLRDKGLHGADTCTRKQVMAQIKKWNTLDGDPVVSEKNPSKGNAELSVSLLQKSTQPDPCDPCAAELDIDSNVGNYLFRVEVHDVSGDANAAKEITLKWSSENAAEQFEAMSTKELMPAGFISDKWLYEFFDMTSEKHLGVHLNDVTWNPVRGVLKEISDPASPYIVPEIDGSTESKVFVRRWDGYCILEKNAGNWRIAKDSNGKIKGMDRGAPLQDTESAALGYVSIESATGLLQFKAKLTSTEITLDLKKKNSTPFVDSSFVAGDYWLAEVREAENNLSTPENAKLIENRLPDGIEHHYLTLGKMSGNVLDVNPEADRRHAFAPLTEMTRLFIAGGDGQEVIPNQPLPQKLRVAVANGEWPVKDALVRFVIDPPNAESSLVPANGIVKTTSEGIAECEWIPGSDENANYSVKVTLVDPNEQTKDLDHPAIYFYANLVSADQVAYTPVCDATLENTVHKLLVDDTSTPPDALKTGADAYYTVNEVLDAVLCRMKAKHIPYNPANKPDRWEDINEEGEGGSSKPVTVQDAIDNIVDNLESTDIRYKLPASCGSATSPTVRTGLGIVAGEYKIDAILDKLLCEFKATALPIDKSDPGLCSELKNNTNVNTVQQAINAVCKFERGGDGCATTVGIGGQYDTLEEAFDKLQEKDNIWICLLAGAHHITSNLTLKNKTIKISGPGSRAAMVYVHKDLVLQSTQIILSGIYFYGSKVGKGKITGGSILLQGVGDSQCVVDNCNFYRSYSGKPKDWKPFVTITGNVQLTWSANSMYTSLQNTKLRSATRVKRESLPADVALVYDELDALWEYDPYLEDKKYYEKVEEVAVKISKLSKSKRQKWGSQRRSDLINKLSDKKVEYYVPEKSTGGVQSGLITDTTAGSVRDRTGGVTGSAAVPADTGARSRTRILSESGAGSRRREFPAGTGFRIRGLVANDNNTVKLSQQEAVNNFYVTLQDSSSITVKNIAEAIINVAFLKTKYDYALALSTNDVDGWILNNEITGKIKLNASANKRLDESALTKLDSRSDAIGDGKLAPVFGKSSLVIENNRLIRVDTFQNPDVIANNGTTWNKPMSGYADIRFNNNDVVNAGNVLVSRLININNNHAKNPEKKFYVVCHAGMASGNLSEQTVLMDVITTNRFVENLNTWKITTRIV